MKLAISQKYEKQIENLYKSIYDALQGEYYEDYIKNKDNNIRLATDAYNNKMYILTKLLECDRVFVEKELAAKKNIVENDYNHLEEIKNKFDVYISNGSILFLFATGIAILVISLVAPPIIITAVVAFSPAIIIVVRCLHLLLDEIVGEDGP